MEWDARGRGRGVGLDSVGHLLPTSCAHPGFRGSGRDQRLAVSHSSGLEREALACRLAASCASTCAVHPGQCAGLSSLVTIIKMPPRNSKGRSQCQTLQTKLHCTILFELYLRVFYKGNHKKPKNQRKLFLYYHKIKIIIIYFCNALQSLNY